MKLFARLGEEIIFKVYFTRKNDIWTINNDKINPKKSYALQCALQKYWKNIVLTYINCYYIYMHIYIYIYLCTWAYVLYNVYSISKYRCIDV